MNTMGVQVQFVERYMMEASSRVVHTLQAKTARPVVPGQTPAVTVYVCPFINA